MKQNYKVKPLCNFITDCNREGLIFTLSNTIKDNNQ